MDRLLVLVRHGQSEWNLKNLFTGWKDVDLTDKGVEEAKAAGQRLKKLGLSFDVAQDRGQSRRGWGEAGDQNRSGARGNAFQVALDNAAGADQAAFGPIRLRRGLAAGLDLRI